MRIFFLFVVVNILIFFDNATAKYLQTTENMDEDKFIYDKYIDMDNTMKNLVNYGIKAGLPYFMEASDHLNLSSNCANNLFTLTTGIKKLKLSAIKFLDASGKIPPGLLTGTITLLGDYDECLETEVLRRDGNVAFTGQYCMLDIKPILPKKKRKITIESGLEELVEYAKNTSELIQFLLSKAQYSYGVGLKYGLCIPSGCSTKDVSKILNYVGEKAFINATVEYCDRVDQLPMHPGTIAGICCFSVIGLFVLVGSLLDYYSRKKGISFEKKISRVMLSFSILTNFPKVISTKTSDTVLTSVFGIRTLSLFFIMLLHQYFFWSLYPVTGHGIYIASLFSNFFFQIPLNGFLLTEVFFFLGGLLNIYTRMKFQENGKHQPSIFEIFIHRLWRIYPTYIFSILTSYLFLNMRGPYATAIKQDFFESCDTKWWKNMLFINNYFNQEKTCMAHTWYIAADMQLFLISLITVPILLRNAKWGLILHVGVLSLGLAATALLAWYKDLMPTALTYYLDLENTQRVRNAHVTTLPHIAPYFTGLILGYILGKWTEFKIPQIYRLLGWPIAAACFVSMLFIPQKWNAGVPYTMVESVLYFALCRFVLVLAVAWLVVCCARGYGGILNYILSLKIWIPFARISYMVYMISPLLQMHYYGSLRTRIDTDYMTLVWRHIGDLGVSCLMGLAMVVIVESPFISMEKLIFHRPSSRKENSPNNIGVAEICVKEVESIKQIERIKNG